ncbi:MAG: hypothetical protein ACYCSO_05265 [Cuniculiplasma sp.]
MESLDLPYAKSILLELLLEDGVPMTTFQKIATSYNTVKKLINSFEKDGLVEKKELMIGRKTFQVSLTPKGRAVAEQLKHAEDAATGKKFTFPDKFAIISFLDKNGSTPLHDLKDEFQDATEMVRELEELKVIKQEINSSSYPPINFIVLTEKGKEIALYLRKIEEIMKGGKSK